MYYSALLVSFLLLSYTHAVPNPSKSRDDDDTTSTKHFKHKKTTKTSASTSTSPVKLSSTSSSVQSFSTSTVSKTSSTFSSSKTSSISSSSKTSSTSSSSKTSSTSSFSKISSTSSSSYTSSASSSLTTLTTSKSVQASVTPSSTSGTLSTSKSSSSSTTGASICTPATSSGPPTVVVTHATVIGTSSAGVDSFLGIPFAQPPIGDLRLRTPQSITNDIGTVVATGTPTACPQMSAAVPTAALLADGIPSDILGEAIGAVLGTALTSNGPQGEDCLTLNVQRPSTANACSKLPVAVWIYGGGFEFGSTQGYDGSNLIKTSVSQGKDIIYVQMNYRLSGFGFMPGKEIMNSGNGNIGLLDQRLAIQWVADNIMAFGGDPTKVTIFGESAGAISVWDQLALYRGDNTYKGKPLFRAAIMDSGSIVPADPLNCAKGQQTYNAVVQAAGCAGTADTLACLRATSYETFNNAVNSVPGIFSYNSVALQYLPRPDGVVLADSPEVLAQAGQYASVPFILGDQEDEGTLFSLSQTNISNNDQLNQYLSTVFFHDATLAQVQGLTATYPDDMGVSGSPFNTGPLYNIYPEYKRLAAILGDLTFTITRRVFLTIAMQVKPTVPFYSYLSTYLAGTPVLGTFHASDLSQVYGSTGNNPIVSSIVQAYYISFFNTMNPNEGTTTPMSLTGTTVWPLWAAGQQLLDFGATGTTTTPDNFREATFNYLSASAATFHI